MKYSDFNWLQKFQQNIRSVWLVLKMYSCCESGNESRLVFDVETREQSPNEKKTSINSLQKRKLLIFAAYENPERELFHT